MPTYFDTLPTYLAPCGVNANGFYDFEADGVTVDAPRWSNHLMAPPSLGDVVQIEVNGIGAGTVVRYFAEGSYLGVVVAVSGRGDVHAFGAELSANSVDTAPRRGVI